MPMSITSGLSRLAIAVGDEPFGSQTAVPRGAIH